MKKGQNVILEQVLLFSVAVVIFVMCFGYFQIYQTQYGIMSANDHVKIIRSIIASHILELTKFDGMDVSFVLQIPKTIAGEYYLIEIEDISGEDYLVIETLDSHTRVTSKVFGMVDGGVYTFDVNEPIGEVSSGEGEIIIYKTSDNKIKIR